MRILEPSDRGYKPNSQSTQGDSQFFVVYFSRMGTDYLAHIIAIMHS